MGHRPRLYALGGRWKNRLKTSPISLQALLAERTMSHDILPRQQVEAEFWPMIKASNLAKWAMPSVGGGPPMIKLSAKKVYYRRQDVIEWLEQHLTNPLPPTAPPTGRKRGRPRKQPKQQNAQAL